MNDLFRPFACVNAEHPVLGEVLDAGLEVAREHFHPFVDSYHCCIGMARICPDRRLIEIGMPVHTAEAIDREVRKMVLAGPAGTRPVRPSPLLGNMVYSALADCFVVGERLGYFHLLMFFLTRHSAANSIFRKPNVDIQERIVAAIRHHAPERVEEYSSYYLSLAALLDKQRRFQLNRNCPPAGDGRR